MDMSALTENNTEKHTAYDSTEYANRLQTMANKELIEEVENIAERIFAHRYFEYEVIKDMQELARTELMNRL